MATDDGSRSPTCHDRWIGDDSLLWRPAQPATPPTTPVTAPRTARRVMEGTCRQFQRELYQSCSQRASGLSQERYWTYLCVFEPIRELAIRPENARQPGMVGRERRGGPANEVSGTSVSFAHRKAAAASGAGRGESPGQPMSTLRAPAATLVDSERARPPRSPGDYVSRAHGASRRERPPTPLAPEARGAQRGLREPCRSEIPLEAGATRRRRSERRQGSRSPRNEVSRTVFPWSRDAERPRAFRRSVS